MKGLGSSPYKLLWNSNNFDTTLSGFSHCDPEKCGLKVRRQGSTAIKIKTKNKALNKMRHAKGLPGCLAHGKCLADEMVSCGDHGNNVSLDKGFTLPGF